MENINIDNRESVLEVAEEMLESGILWFLLNGEEIYTPDFIDDVKKEKVND